jgi:two-component system nitrogen regulation response regulator GlnG
MPTLLVIDDDPAITLVVREVFSAPGFSVISAGTGTEGLRAIASARPDVVLLDVVLPDATGHELFERIRKLDPRLPVIFVTARGTSSTAIEAMKLGAHDFLVKPFQFDALRKLVAIALETCSLTQVQVEVRENGGYSNGPDDLLIGRSAAMQDVYKSIGRLARQDQAVLICGETGSGKELVAKAIHQHSSRSSVPLMTINCAGVTELQVESELFGHERWAFLGADRQRVGKVEDCAGGMLLLDEVADLPLATQGKILKLLDERQFQRVGGTQWFDADVRCIATTSRNLEELLTAGRLRPDLYYRLMGLTIRMPSLRECREDLEVLARHFVQRIGREMGKQVFGLAPGTLEILARYDWPGNVRELQSVLRQALAAQPAGKMLLAEFLPSRLLASAGAGSAAVEPGAYLIDWQTWLNERLQGEPDNIYAEALEVMERPLLTLVLRATGGNQMQAAKLLGITRSNLRNKLRSLGIVVDRVVVAAEEAEATLQ